MNPQDFDEDFYEAGHRAWNFINKLVGSDTKIDKDRKKFIEFYSAVMTKLLEESKD